MEEINVIKKQQFFIFTIIFFKQLSESSQLTPNKTSQFSFRSFFQHFGPGLLISIAYLDPGNCTQSDFLLKKIEFFKSIRRFRRW